MVSRAAFPADYATCLAAGLDTVEETFKWKIDHRQADYLDGVQRAAGEADPRGKAVVAAGFGGERVAMRSHGAKGGFRWVFANDDLQFMVQPAKLGAAKVRYLAAGLWEHGLPALRARAAAALARSGQATAADWRRLLRADYAFDFYSPAFTREMVPGIAGAVVCHSSTKHRSDFGSQIGRSGGVETLTVGAAGGMQVQVYDNGLEITEASGKTWMLELWQREGYWPPMEGRPRDVWRLECRFWKTWLRERNLLTVEDFGAELPALIAEALHTRRLTVPQADSNRRRWPLHPLWALACDAAGGADMVPLGRRVTGRRAVVMETLIAQAAGTLRAASVAGTGDFRLDGTRDLFQAAQLRLESDERAAAKVAKLKDRYELLDEAQ